MFIIDCLPFSKGLNKDLLSYFSVKRVEPGSLIKVNIRNKSTHALVLEARDAREVKTEIKSAEFQLKKINTVASKPFLQKEYLEAVDATAKYFASTSGAVLSHLLPAFVLENPNMLTIPKELFPKEKKEGDMKEETKKVKVEISVLQAEDEGRYVHYRSLIREEFARNKSVYLCLPQNEGLLEAKAKLERGIESFVCIFHPEMSGAELKKEWKKALTSKHPVLVIATARWLFLGRNDFGTIVIDKENENGWKTLSRPFLDLRFFAETLARSRGIRAMIGDSSLRAETLYRYKQGEATEFENVKWRISSAVKEKVVDMREAAKKEKEFKSVSREMLDLIRETGEQGSHMFIFAARKGLSPTTICRDCGEQVKCGNCSSPMVLYKTKTGGAFKCHQCDETRDAAEICQNCKSWKLGAFGSGIDRVAEEIKKEFPHIRLFELHKEVAKNASEASDIAQDFYNQRGSILLGTEMAQAYLHKKIGNTAIAAFDSLFSIPDFRIREKIFRLIIQTKSLAKENFLIQTRNSADPTILFALSGNLLEFYKKELEDRQALGYPPFGIFIKITVRGTKSFIEREYKNLHGIFSTHPEYKLTIFASTHEKKGEPAAINTVIKLKKPSWPDPALISILKSLPSHFEIKVDPDNLL